MGVTLWESEVTLIRAKLICTPIVTPMMSSSQVFWRGSWGGGGKLEGRQGEARVFREEAGVGVLGGSLKFPQS